MSNLNDLKVLIVATEVNPYAKSGGLGDVIGSLPIELVNKGIDARVVFPKYKTIKKELLKNLTYLDSVVIKQDYREQSASIHTIDSEVKTYLIENDYYFSRDGFYGYGDDYERFSFFSEAVIAFLGVIDFKPDIIHLNDWQTGLVSVYLKDNYNKFLFYSNIKTLFTIHNLQYQGVFGREVLNSINLNDGYFNPDKLEFYGKINYMKAGLTYADAISTVSESYANEIQTSDFGYGLDGILRSRRDDLYGILNGIDLKANDPATDKRIFVNYDINSIDKKVENKSLLQKELNLPVRDVPMFSIISRLVDQKGLNLIEGIMEELLSKDIQFVVLGTGDGRYEHLFRHMAYRYPDKVSANIFYNEELAQKIYAGSDIFLMPSLFEPCGLGQMFAMRYGTIPIARKTGGLQDTIKHYNYDTGEGNGFLFEDFLSNGLMWAINESLSAYYNKEHFKKIIGNAMSTDFSWGTSADKYIKIYEKLKG